METNLIKSFSVYGLFGTHDVHIPFDENIKILIGENGIGKTQVLNLLYYTLTKNFFRLSEFNFHRLVLSFSSSLKIELTKEQINEFIKEYYKHPAIEQFIREFGYAEFEILMSRYFDDNKINRRKLEMDFEFNSKYRKFPAHRIFRVLDELEMTKKYSKSDTENALYKCEKQITNEIKKYDIMYFPTFRRVEEDLHNLGYYDEEELLNQEKNLIQFGMGDVQKKFNQIENKIDKLLKDGLAQFTKDILNVVIDEDFEEDNSLTEKITTNDIDIILSRVGSLLPNMQKETVRNIVAEKKIKNPLSKYLLKKLIEIYEKQKEIDTSVKTFRDICNKYLINKKVFYDESAIKIYIKSELTNEPIELRQLSSGEKQIISIFSKIYLSEADKRFIVLFDEPELSLSIFWQRNLLPDIVNSQKCTFLLAVTHSPFIFENELDRYAIGLNEYVSITKSMS